MEELSGGEMVVRALADEGVEFIFGYPGGAVLHIYDALFQQDQVAHILVRHEQAATHAADGYARATGKPGAVLVTSGPGATNAITGIATASMDSIPMVVISGQVISDWIGDDAFQETDTLGISRPLVKHSWMVRDPREIPDIFRKAFYIANSGRPGPVLIDIPKDMTAPHNKYPYEYPEQLQMRSYNPVTRGHSGQIRKAVNAMLQAKRPVIYAGGGAIQGEAHEVLTRLARKLNFPVTNTLMGLGAYPGSDPQFLGMLGQHGTYEANMAMHHADFILCAGARLDDRVTNNADKFCPSATLVHIDVDPASISKNVPANIPIVGPLDQVLGEMLDMVEHSEDQPDEKDLERWWEEVQGWSQYHGLRYERDADGPMKPQQVVETLYEVTHGDAYVTSDVGQHQMFAAQFYKFDHPRYWINSGGLGTMGFGFPAAMGVQFAYPDAMVACVTGEGSILMNIQELSTCLQYGLPIKIININNQALGMVRQWQDMQYGGRHSQSYMDSLPDFIALAQAYGHVGMKVERAEDLEGAMKEAFAMTDRLVFMDIYVDPAEHVYPMHIAGGAINDMWLSKTERT